MRIINIVDNQFVTMQEFGLTLDSIYLLERYVYEEEINYKDNSILASLQKLKRKGYLDDKGITKEGIEFYYKLERVDNVPLKRVKIPDNIFDGWHKEFSDMLLQLTGKSQVRVDIKGTKYSFLCGERDLIKKLNEVIKAYDLTDLDKVKLTLKEYIRRCAKNDSWTPLFKYYIMKDGMSDLVTDLENVVEVEVKKENKLIEVKDLF